MSDTITTPHDTTSDATTSDANDGAGTNGEGNGSAPRPEKVAIVEEITAKLSAANAVFVAEYRGMTVGQLAGLRNALRPSDAELKVYKNTLARFAARDAGLEGFDEMLVGPTALAFVGGDIAGAAKALRDVSRTNPLLVLKGGSLGGSVLSGDDLRALADLPSREQLLAQLAGALQAPLVKTAGLLQALPRNFAYGLKALIEQQEQAAA
jgi:large subunit ribosomal protein L10